MVVIWKLGVVELTGCKNIQAKDITIGYSLKLWKSNGQPHDDKCEGGTRLTNSTATHRCLCWIRFGESLVFVLDSDGEK
jgi:hypothetical protein